MARDKRCELCDPIALRAEADDWWEMFQVHAIKAQPDIDRAALARAIANFRDAQRSLTDVLGPLVESN